MKSPIVTLIKEMDAALTVVDSWHLRIVRANQGEVVLDANSIGLVDVG
jgi:hypothetical protein